MPICNRISFVNRSLTTAQQQITPKLEILCVDDCSTEPVPEFIIERMKKDRRIKLVQNFYSQGSFHSRKNGVFSSKGRYIISIDSDDIILPNSIYPVYNFAMQLNADVVDYVAENKVLSPVITKEMEKFISNDWKPCKKNYTSRREIMLKFRMGKICCNVWKRMIKRQLYVKALSFISRFVIGKKLIRTEDLFSLGSVFLFTSNIYCIKHKVYVHFMYQENSVENGGFQSRQQNSNQSRFTRNIVRYLYYKKRQDFVNGNLKEFLSNPKNLGIYNRMTNIDSSVHRRSCEIHEYGFKHIDRQEYGCCLLERVD